MNRPDLLTKHSYLLDSPFCPKIEAEPIQHGHLPSLDHYDRKEYNNEYPQLRFNFHFGDKLSKKPRMIDFLDGNDHGPMTVEEGHRYTREQKAQYLATRFMKSWESDAPVSLCSTQLQEAA